MTRSRSRWLSSRMDEPEFTVARSVPAPHAVECEVHRRLRACPDLVIKSLAVHRLPEGVCLEGQVEAVSSHLNLKQLLADIDGLGLIVNHLLVHPLAEVDAPRAEPKPIPMPAALDN